MLDTRSETSSGLATFVARARWEDLPEEVRRAAKRSLLNFFAAAFAGSRDSASDIAWASLSPFSGPARATVIGRPGRVDVPLAALLNAASANIHDFDDTHVRTVIHPTAPVAPALLALSEHMPVTGPELLHALALGMETACRIGNAVSPEHYRRGWHITATCGIFGAAVAAGKLHGLDATRMLWALGNASARSAGLVETLGFMAKSFGVGGAARDGLLAAVLAHNGFDGPSRPLEGERGFLSVLGDAADEDEITEGLATRWEILKNVHKPYPCGIVLNAVIDGCLDLHARAAGRLDDIDSITLHGHPLLRQRADRPDVSTGREAQVSAQHAVAVCLVSGAAGLDQFSDAAVADPRLGAMRRKVHIEEAADMPIAGIRIVARFANGRQETVTVEHARGTDQRPLGDGEIEDKLRTLIAWNAPGMAGQAGALIDLVWGLEDCDDASALLTLARPA